MKEAWYYAGLLKQYQKNELGNKFKKTLVNGRKKNKIFELYGENTHGGA